MHACVRWLDLLLLLFLLGMIVVYLILFCVALLGWTQQMQWTGGLYAPNFCVIMCEIYSCSLLLAEKTLLSVEYFSDQDKIVGRSVGWLESFFPCVGWLLSICFNLVWPCLGELSKFNRLVDYMHHSVLLSCVKHTLFNWEDPSLFNWYQLYQSLDLICCCLCT